MKFVENYWSWLATVTAKCSSHPIRQTEPASFRETDFSWVRIRSATEASLYFRLYLMYNVSWFWSTHLHGNNALVGIKHIEMMKIVMRLVYDLPSLMCILVPRLISSISQVGGRCMEHRSCLPHHCGLNAATCHSRQSMEYKAPHQSSILLTFNGPFFILTMTKCSFFFLIIGQFCFYGMVQI